MVLRFCGSVDSKPTLPLTNDETTEPSNPGTTELFYNQEPGLDAIIRDPVPHHPRSSDCDGVAELHFLAGVQRGIRVNGSEPALAVVEQMTDDFLR